MSKPGPVRRTFGRLLRRALGFKVVGEVPPFAKCVVVVAPHTSNWDFPAMMAIGWELGLSYNWFGKHTIFVGPFGWVLRKWGGVPVDRSTSHDFVQSVAATFAREPEFRLALSPEGTRKKVEHWKSGFYWIAKTANVPIVLSFLDWEKREGGIGPSFVPTDDLAADVARIHAFYADKHGKVPALFTNISFAPRDEPKA